MIQVIKVRNPRTNRDKYYEQDTNKLIAYYEEPDIYGDEHLTITDYGSDQGYYSGNNNLCKFGESNKITIRSKANGTN